MECSQTCLHEIAHSVRTRIRVGRTVHETQRRDRLGSSSETLSCPRLLVEKEFGADVIKELLGTEQPKASRQM